MAPSGRETTHLGPLPAGTTQDHSGHTSAGPMTHADTHTDTDTSDTHTHTLTLLGRPYIRTQQSCHHYQHTIIHTDWGECLRKTMLLRKCSLTAKTECRKLNCQMSG